MTLAVDGPDLPVRGVVRGDREETPGWIVVGSRLPVSTGHGARGPLRVWRTGEAIRTETLGGEVRLIAGPDEVWSFPDDPGGDPAVPHVSWRHLLKFAGGGTALLRRAAVADFLTGRFSRPVGEPAVTTHLDRLAWVQGFADAADPAAVTEVVVDAQTGLLLRVAGPSRVEEWTEFQVVDHVPEGWLRWDGPTREQPHALAEDVRRQQRDDAAGQEWFAAVVAPLDRVIRARARFRLELQWVNEFDEVSGGFDARWEVTEADAGFAQLNVVRAPRGGRLRIDGSEQVFRWETENFVWGAQWWGGDLGEDAVAELAASFGDGPR